MRLMPVSFVSSCEIMSDPITILHKSQSKQINVGHFMSCGQGSDED